MPLIQALLACFFIGPFVIVFGTLGFFSGLAIDTFKFGYQRADDFLDWLTS